MQKNNLEDHFNQRLLVNDHAILQLLADRVNVDPDFKDALFQLVFASKNNEKLKIAAANAITILNRAGVSFSGLDLSGIQIPGADLSYVLMHRTNLRDANLQGVNFRGAYLCDADLSGSNLTNANFGQLFFSQIEGYLNNFRYCPKNNYLALSIEKVVKIFDMETREIYATFNNDANNMYFSPDGHFLAITQYRIHTLIFDLKTKDLLTKINHTSSVEYAVFSFDNQLLACGNSMGQLDLFDIQAYNPTVIKTISLDKAIRYIVFSPNNKWLAISHAHSVSLVDVASGTIFPNFADLQGAIWFSPDSNFLFGRTEEGKILYILEMATKTIKGRFKGHEHAVACVSISPDGKLLATGGIDHTIRIWDIEARELIGKPLRDHTNNINDIAFSQDGKYLASASEDCTTRIWDVSSQRQVGKPLWHKNAVHAVAFATNDLMLITISKYTFKVKLWDVKILIKESRTLQKQLGKISRVGFSADSKTIAAIGNKKTQFFNVENQHKINSFIPKNRSKNISISFSSTSPLLAAISPTKVELWNLKNQRKVGSYDVDVTQQHGSIVFSPDNHLMAVCGSDNYKIYLININDLKEMGCLTGHELTVTSLVFNPDGKLLISSSRDHSIRFWDIETFKQISKPLMLHTDEVTCLAISPDGEYLASGSNDKTVRLSSITNKKLLYTFKGHNNRVTSIAFSPDGKLLATGSLDQTVCFWSIVTMQRIRIFYDLRSINNICFSNDGNYFAIGSDNGFVLLQRNNKLSGQDNYCLIKYKGLKELIASRIRLVDTIGLSNDNLQLLISLGAVCVNTCDELIIPESSDLISGSKNPEIVSGHHLIDEISIEKITQSLQSYQSPSLTLNKDYLVNLLHYFVGKRSKQDEAIHALIDGFVSDHLFQVDTCKNLLLMFPAIRINFIATCRKIIQLNIYEIKITAAIIKYHWLFNESESAELLKLIPAKYISDARYLIAKAAKKQEHYYKQLLKTASTINLVCPSSRGVGNSSIVKRFIHENFVEKYDPPIEDNYSKNILLNDQSYMLDISVVAGQEEYKALRNVYIRMGHAFLLVHDCTSITSFEGLDHYYKSIMEVNKFGNYAPKILVCNKIDLQDSRITTFEEAWTYALLKGVPYIETSAKLNLNIALTFETLTRIFHYDCCMAKLLLELDMSRDEKNIFRDKNALISTALSFFQTLESGTGRSNTGESSNNDGPDSKDEKCILM